MIILNWSNLVMSWVESVIIEKHWHAFISAHIVWSKSFDHIVISSSVIVPMTQVLNFTFFARYKFS